jgi:hypothetical protein
MLTIGRKNDPPIPDRLAQTVAVGLSARLFEWRNEAGDDAIALRDQHGLSLLGEVNILGELTLKLLESDGAHSTTLAPVPPLGQAATL